MKTVDEYALDPGLYILEMIASIRSANIEIVAACVNKAVFENLMCSWIAILTLNNDVLVIGGIPICKEKIEGYVDGIQFVGKNGNHFSFSFL